MGTNSLLKIIGFALCAALALSGHAAIASCGCGCVDVDPFTACCCDAGMSRSGAVTVTEGRDDCRVEMGDQRPPADAPPLFRLNPPVTAIAATDVDVRHWTWTVQSDGGAEWRPQLASSSSQGPRAPPLV